MKNLILLILTFISIVTTSFGQVKLTNRILVDPTISDSNDYSKKFKFNLSNFTPGSTRIYTFPDSNITLVGESSIQSLTNKTFNADSNTISNISNNSIKSGAGIDATKIADGSVTNTEFQYLNGVTSNIVGVSDTQIFTNKTFTDATTYFQDNLDNTKKVQFQLSGISSATTRALTIPDTNTTIVGTDATQTLTNKTINSSNNSISLSAADITDFNSAADARIAIQKGTANGLATLDSGGKVPAFQLNLSSVAYQGTWNSTTNTPTLSDGVGSQGNYYVISVAGTTSLDGITDWQTGDWAIFNGTAWEKADHTDAVSSVAGKQGAVTLQLEDIADLSSTDDLPEGSNLYYSDARVNANTNVAANTTHTSLTNNPHSVTKVQIGLSNVENLKVNLSATTFPTIIDDTTLGYSVGSRWIDNTNNKEYVCVDATTTAAIWNETTSAEQVSAGTGLSKTGNTIDAVGSTTIIANTNNLEVNSSNTNNEILLSAGSVGIAATYGALPLNNSNSVSGVLGLANGGTNSSSFSAGSRIIATNSGNTALESTSLDPSSLLTTSGVQTLTNKTFTDNTTIIQDNIDNTKKIQFELSGITGGVTRILTIPDNSVTIVGANSAQTLTNKTLITPVIATISNTGTLTLPTSTTTLVGRATVDTFTNKTISSANNTIDISASDITSGTFPDARIAQSNITQHEGSITHQNISGVGTNTHAQIDTHLADASIHRTINDAGTSNTELWSASKINTEITNSGNGKIPFSESNLINLANSNPGDVNHVQFKMTKSHGGVDDYNLGIGSSPTKVLSSLEGGTYRQAMVFSDAISNTATIFGVATSSNNGSIWNPRFTISQNGRVGLGTSSPTEVLDIEGNIAITGTVDGRDLSADGATLDNHTTSTSSHGVSGNVVGTTDTQTLTNKTINSSNNSISLNATDITDFNSAADARIAIQKGNANGIATLDGGGKVPVSQLPTAPVASITTEGLVELSTNAEAAAPTAGVDRVVTEGNLEYFITNNVGFAKLVAGKIPNSQLPAPTISNNMVSSTVTTSTTSTTYTVINGMTTTPVAGTYMVSFSASGNSSSAPADGEYSIHIEGTIVSDSIRKFLTQAGIDLSDTDLSLHSQSIVTVNGTQAIDVRYKTTSGTFTVNTRNMILLKVN